MLKIDLKDYHQKLSLVLFNSTAVDITKLMISDIIPNDK